jgi:hypothetical protein
MAYLTPQAALLLAALPCLANCTETDPPSPADAGPDRGLDMRGDLRRDGQVTPRLDVHDAATDALFDQMKRDVTIVDSSLSAATVLYTPASQSSSFGLRTVSTTGGGKPAAVSGWSGQIDFEALNITGLQEVLPVDRSVPQPRLELDTEFQGVALPGGLGTLYSFHRKLTGTSGLLQITPGGKLTTLVEVPGIYQDTLANRVALTPDGKFGAALQDSESVLLFRTDGGTFGSSGKASIDVSPAAGVVTVIKPRSLTFVGTWLYCVGAVTSGADLLLRAPADGSTPLKQVSLPKISDKVPAHISDGLAASADGSTLAVLAGAGPSERDLLAVAAAAGTVTNLTQKPGTIAERGDQIGLTNGAQLALSTKGTLAAYVVDGQELYVVKTDGSMKPVHVTKELQFNAAVVIQLNLIFVSDSDLLWMAGDDLSNLDLYRWDSATQQAHNLTGYGSTTVPFKGDGAMRPRALWRSPNGKWLYWIEYRSDLYTTDLRAVDLSSWKVHAVTQGAEVQYGAGMAVACPTSSKLYFVAEPHPIKNNREVWVQDLNDGSKPAVKLTTMSTTPTSTWYVFNLRLSPDCSRLAYSAGGSYWLRNVWLQETAKGAGTAQKITTPPLYLHQTFHFTPDRAALVFGAGGAPDTGVLKAVPLPPGSSVTLDSTAGYTHIFAVY